MPNDIFSALADPTRRKIIELLAEHEECPASFIHEQFSVSPQAISQHLKILLGANIVSVEKKAQQRIYRLNPMVMFKFDEWSNRVKQTWNRRLDALDAVLKNEMENMINNHDQEVDDEPKS